MVPFTQPNDSEMDVRCSFFLLLSSSHCMEILRFVSHSPIAGDLGPSNLGAIMSPAAVFFQGQVFA